MIILMIILGWLPLDNLGVKRGCVLLINQVKIKSSKKKTRSSKD